LKEVSCNFVDVNDDDGGGDDACVADHPLLADQEGVKNLKKIPIIFF